MATRVRRVRCYPPRMNTVPAYQQEAYERELQTRVVRCDPGPGGGFLVELEDTILYPEGGGQPSDTGWIGDVRVHEVRKDDGRIVHHTDGAVPEGPVQVRLDWDRRFDHMQQHTAQHVLTVLASEHLGWATTGFGIGPEVSYIDLDVKAPKAGDLRRLEDLAAVEIRAARKVRVRWTNREEMEALPVRSRRLPGELEGPVRLVEIEELDLNTCGGTHVGNTSELETICLVGTAPMHGGTRVSWVAGGRVRRRMAARENLVGSLRALTGAGDEELAAVVGLKLEQLGEAGAELRRLRERLAAALVDELRRENGPVVARELEDPDLVWTAASALAGSRGATAYLLTARDGAFALALAAEVPVDVGELGPTVAGVLEGKGGGRDRLFRGKAVRPERLEEASRVLADRLGSA